MCNVLKRIMTITIISVLLCISSSYAETGLFAEDCINVRNLGAYGNGTTDDTAVIQQAIKLAISTKKGIVYIPSGTYMISSTIVLDTNVRIVGEGAESVIYSPSLINDTALFRGDKVSDIVIERLTFKSDHVNYYGISLYNCEKIKINDCYFKHSAAVLVKQSSDVSEYSGISESHMSKNIIITNNIADGAGKEVSTEACIAVVYTNGAIVSDNKIDGYSQGIQWWGGDSNNIRGDGAKENERKCKNLIITGNLVSNIGNGGIWGSMGENLTISHNSVYNCGDVGIDPEGCYYVTISNNLVQNCKNGCISTFFICKGIILRGNVIYSDVAGQFLVKIYNSSQTSDNDDLTFDSNIFVNTSGSIGYVGGDNCQKLVYTNNQFVNVVIQHNYNNQRYIRLYNNNMQFNVSNESSFLAVSVGKTTTDGEVIVQNNTIISDVEQPIGSTAIYIWQADSNSSPLNIVEGNTIKGFHKSIHFVNGSKSTSYLPRLLIKNNVFDNGTISHSGNVNPLISGNHLTDGSIFPGQIPSSGYYTKGQIIYFDDPLTEGYVGAICTETGEPGTWRFFGEISW